LYGFAYLTTADVFTEFVFDLKRSAGKTLPLVAPGAEPVSQERLWSLSSQLPFRTLENL
jgi:hypothetical protein